MDCTATHHGTHVAYDWWGCRCPNAREAWRIYRKRLREGRQPAALIPAVGTVRRLQGLVALGYSWSNLSHRLGVSVARAAQVGKLPLNGQVNRRTAARVRDLYDELAATPGADQYARTVARRHGFHPPLAWDDDTIDDPKAQPDLGDDTRGDEYDQITVGLAVTGRLTYTQIAVHRPDLIETVRRLAQHHTDQEIADQLRWPGADDKRGRSSTRAVNSINKIRRDNGITSCQKPAEQIIPRIRRPAATKETQAA